jgi:large subunit ribosomal protein L21
MSSIAVIKTGGKQYLVKSGETIVVDKINAEVGKMIELPLLAKFDEDGKNINLGKPVLEDAKALCVVMEHGKGMKIRVAKFKSKVRYRKVTGFRPQLTKIVVKSV